MRDSLGRNIDYLRISVTDRCNLRCLYCMPESGVVMTDHAKILTFDEILRLVRIFASIGISKIKITGGEPLCRLGVDELIANIKDTEGIEQVTLTTNAVELASHLEGLYSAGLDAMNISLDTLDSELFKAITRRDKLAVVAENIEKAIEFGKIPLKINCVPMTDKQKLYDVAEYARDRNVSVRYIEMMPIGLGKDFEFISRERVMEILEEKVGKLTPVSEKLGNGPAEYYKIEGFKGRIGFISAISHKFCESCNRIRLTASGYLKTCLQFDRGVDLKELLRGGATDDEIKAAIVRAIEDKPASHRFDSDGGDETRMMSQIGG